MAVVGILAFGGTVQSQKIYTYKLATISVQPQKRPVQNAYSIDYLKGFSGKVSIKYGLSPEQYLQMMQTIQCESGWKTDTFSHGKISYGISQYTPPTFLDFCDGDYKDPLAQLNCMAKMFHAGLEKRWDCWRNLFMVK